jgi:hypothetical protein
MYSKYNYLYNPPTISIGGYFNVINIFIVIILIVCFYILINNFSISNFSNITANSDSPLNESDSTYDHYRPSECAYDQNRASVNTYDRRRSYVNTYDNHRPSVITDDIEYKYMIDELKSELQTIKSELTSIKPELNAKKTILPNMNTILPNTNIISPDTNIILPPSPPIIYDPIESYDRKKLLDPLIDPRGRSSADQIPTPQIAAQLNFPTQGILDRYHRVGLLIAINDDKVHNDRNRNNQKYYEDFGNIEKINKSGKITNTDTDSSNSSSCNKNNKNNRYKDNSSDIHTIDNSNDSSNSFHNNNYKKKIIPNNVVLEITDRDNDILELIGKKIANEWYRYFTSISKGNKIIKINVHNRNRKELYDGDIVYIPILKRYYRVKIDKLDMIEYNPYFF